MIDKGNVSALLTTTLAGKKIGRHPRTIVSWIRRGWLPAHKLPGPRGQYLIDPQDLDRVAQERNTPRFYTPENHENETK